MAEKCYAFRLHKDKQKIELDRDELLLIADFVKDLENEKHTKNELHCLFF